MRKRFITLLFLLSTLTLLSVVNGWASDTSPLDAFPAAGEGEVRHVIVLDEKSRAEEGNFKVELIPGKVVATDGVNSVRLGLGIEAVSLKGWGYTYYRVTGKGEQLSTMMAVPEGAEPVDRFVAGASEIIRYNSRLPVVIYSPEGVEIRYRIWVAGDEQVADNNM